MILEGNINDFDMQLSSFRDWERWCAEWESAGPSYTMFADKEIVACAGVMILPYNIGQAWMIARTTIAKYKKAVYAEVTKRLTEIQKEYKLVRIQALVLPEFEVAQRFVDRLGFEKEGLLKKVGPNNEDFLMYARF